MSEDMIAQLAQRRRFQSAYELRPENYYYLSFLLNCQIKILIVTDSSGGFSETTPFHLGQVIKILNDDPWSHIDFVVTKAHRATSSESDVIDNFRFNTHDLSQYSQIWLFGIDRAGDGAPLQPAELRALTEFMDAGGGVLAMGDHEDLGYSMCGDVPRVRSMRRWYFNGASPNPSPAGEPNAPSVSGARRHDTLVDNGTQTDAYPQEIYPKFYTRTTGNSIIRRTVKYPHPVLCAPSGPINYLPDHMHEGWCEVPTDLDKSYNFDGKTFVEYPTQSGYQEVPEVIATADNVNISNQAPSVFGVVGAYDGHRAGVGRVVVDATWHHWFNVNTLPYINASDPEHPAYTPTTVAKWEEIKAYYRNVAVWLPGPAYRKCIRNTRWIRVLGEANVLMAVQKLDRVHEPLRYYWLLGNLALDALGRGAPQCQTVAWTLDLLYERELPFRIDPWDQKLPSQQFFDLPEGLDVEELEAVMVGAGVHGAAEKFKNISDPRELMKNDGAALEAELRASAQHGLQAFAKRGDETVEQVRNFVREVRPPKTETGRC